MVPKIFQILLKARLNNIQTSMEKNDYRYQWYEPQQEKIRTSMRRQQKERKERHQEAQRQRNLRMLVGMLPNWNQKENERKKEIMFEMERQKQRKAQIENERGKEKEKEQKQLFKQLFYKYEMGIWSFEKILKSIDTAHNLGIFRNNQDDYALLIRKMFFRGIIESITTAKKLLKHILIIFTFEMPSIRSLESGVECLIYILQNDPKKVTEIESPPNPGHLYYENGTNLNLAVKLVKCYLGIADLHFHARAMQSVTDEYFMELSVLDQKRVKMNNENYELFFQMLIKNQTYTDYVARHLTKLIILQSYFACQYSFLLYDLSLITISKPSQAVFDLWRSFIMLIKRRTVCSVQSSSFGEACLVLLEKGRLNKLQKERIIECIHYLLEEAQWANENQDILFEFSKLTDYYRMNNLKGILEKLQELGSYFENMIDQIVTGLSLWNMKFKQVEIERVPERYQGQDREQIRQ